MNLYVISRLFYGVSGIYRKHESKEDYWENIYDKKYVIRKVEENVWEFAVSMEKKDKDGTEYINYQTLMNHCDKSPYGIWKNETIYVFGFMDEDPNVLYMNGRRE